MKRVDGRFDATNLHFVSDDLFLSRNALSIKRSIALDYSYQFQHPLGSFEKMQEDRFFLRVPMVNVLRGWRIP